MFFYTEAEFLAAITGSGSGGSATWGQITGTLSAQTDLQTALNLKANSKLQNPNEVYVDYTNGNNTTGLGTFDKPYATLQNALSQVALSNSIIYVNGNAGTLEATTGTITINRNFDNLTICGIGNSLLFDSTAETSLTHYQNIVIAPSLLNIRIAFEKMQITNFEGSPFNSFLIFQDVKINNNFLSTAKGQLIVFICVDYSGATILLSNGTLPSMAFLTINTDSFEGLSNPDNITVSSDWRLQNLLIDAIKKYAIEGIPLANNTTNGLLDKELYPRLLNSNSLFVLADSDIDTLLPPGNLGTINDPFTGLTVPNAINLDPTFVNATSYLRVEQKDLNGNTINATLFLPDYTNYTGALYNWANRQVLKISNHAGSVYNLNILTTGTVSGARTKIKRVDGNITDSIIDIPEDIVISLRWSGSRQRFEEQ